MTKLILKSESIDQKILFWAAVNVQWEPLLQDEKKVGARQLESPKYSKETDAIHIETASFEKKLMTEFNHLLDSSKKNNSWEEDIGNIDCLDFQSFTMGKVADYLLKMINQFEKEFNDFLMANESIKESFENLDDAQQEKMLSSIFLNFSHIFTSSSRYENKTQYKFFFSFLSKFFTQITGWKYFSNQQNFFERIRLQAILLGTAIQGEEHYALMIEEKSLRERLQANAEHLIEQTTPVDAEDMTHLLDKIQKRYDIAATSFEIEENISDESLLWKIFSVNIDFFSEADINLENDVVFIAMLKRFLTAFTQDKRCQAWMKERLEKQIKNLELNENNIAYFFKCFINIPRDLQIDFSSLHEEDNPLKMLYLLLAKNEQIINIVHAQALSASDKQSILKYITQLILHHQDCPKTLKDNQIILNEISLFPLASLKYLAHLPETIQQNIDFHDENGFNNALSKACQEVETVLHASIEKTYGHVDNEKKQEILCDLLRLYRNQAFSLNQCIYSVFFNKMAQRLEANTVTQEERLDQTIFLSMSIPHHLDIDRLANIMRTLHPLLKAIPSDLTQSLYHELDAPLKNAYPEEAKGFVVAGHFAEYKFIRADFDKQGVLTTFKKLVDFHHRTGALVTLKEIQNLGLSSDEHEDALTFARSEFKDHDKILKTWENVIKESYRHTHQLKRFGFFFAPKETQNRSNSPSSPTSVATMN